MILVPCQGTAAKDPDRASGGILFFSTLKTRLRSTLLSHSVRQEPLL